MRELTQQVSNWIHHTLIRFKIQRFFFLTLYLAFCIGVYFACEFSLALIDESTNHRTVLNFSQSMGRKGFASGWIRIKSETKPTSIEDVDTVGRSKCQYGCNLRICEPNAICTRNPSKQVNWPPICGAIFVNCGQLCPLVRILTRVLLLDHIQHAFRIIYGRVINAFFPIITTNAIGLAFSSWYTIIYYTYAKQRSRIAKQCFLVASTVSLVFLYTLFSPEPMAVIQHRVGLICVVVCVGMYASPLATIQQVIKTRSTASLPLPLITAGCLCSFLWSIYGILQSDPFVIFPNSISLFLGILQLSLFYIYPYQVKEIPQTLLEK